MSLALEEEKSRVFLERVRALDWTDVPCIIYCGWLAGCLVSCHWLDFVPGLSAMVCMPHDRPAWQYSVTLSGMGRTERRL